MSKADYVIGLHAVEALLSSGPDRVTTVLLQKSRDDERLKYIVELATAQSINIEYLTRHKLDEIVNNSHHQGVVAVTKSANAFDESLLPDLLSNIKQPALILVLDGVQDPHNLGACMRSADAFGVNMIIAPKDKAVGITPVVRKVACGAAESVPFIRVTNIARTLRLLQDKGVWLIGTDDQAETTLQEVDMSGDIALIMGSEGSGMRQLTKKHCDFLVNIPMQGMVSSLNVSVATGVSLYEVQRQRVS